MGSKLLDRLSKLEAKKTGVSFSVARESIEKSFEALYGHPFPGSFSKDDDEIIKSACNELPPSAIAEILNRSVESVVARCDVLDARDAVN